VKIRETAKVKNRINSQFILPVILLFLIEVFIAAFVNDSIIRPYVGDVLVVILIYFFIRMVTKFEHRRVLIGVLLFSFFVEFTQYFDLITYLNLQNSTLAKLILGTTFNIVDFLAYSIGAVIICIFRIIVKSHIMHITR
jgi:hypothetical protein